MDTENKDYLQGPLDPEDNDLKIRIRDDDFISLTNYIDRWLNKDRTTRGQCVPKTLPPHFYIHSGTGSANVERYKEGEALLPAFKECYDRRLKYVDSKINDREKDVKKIEEVVHRWDHYYKNPEIAEQQKKVMLPDYDVLEAELKILHELRDASPSWKPLMAEFKIWVNANFSVKMWRQMLNARKQHNRRERVTKKNVELSESAWEMVDNIKTKEKITFDDAIILVCEAYHRQPGKERRF